MSNANITIAYFTCRKDPKIEWFFNSLNRELHGNWEGVHIMIIDYYYQYDLEERSKELRRHYERYTSQVTHMSPKPCAYQGKHKITKANYFAASNARNTAFLHCKTDYIVCIDDLTVLKEGWMNVARWAQTNRFVVYGSYAKVKNLQCDEEGKYCFDEASLQTGLDSRFNSPILHDEFAAKVAGSWLFGCSFGMPLSLALEADGFDESCDCQGAEDYDFGIRIGRITHDIYYSKKMFTYEDDDLHFAPGNEKFVRESKVLTPLTSMKSKIGVSSDHAMLQHVINSNSHRPYRANNLKAVRHDIISGTFKTEDYVQTMPKVDWRDGKHLCEM